MAAPTWQANGSPTATATLDNRTPTLPAHATDDILVVAAIKNDAGNLTITAGWNVLGAPESNLNMSTGLWWKRAASGAEANPTVTSSTLADASNVLVADSFNIRGCITTIDPFEAGAWSGSPVSSTAVLSSAITTLGADRMVVCFALIDDDTGHSGTPVGWTNQEDVTTATGGDAAIVIHSIEKAAAGSVAQVTASTISSAAYWRTFTVAFIPPGGVSASGAPGPLRRATNPLLVR